MMAENTNVETEEKPPETDASRVDATPDEEIPVVPPEPLPMFRNKYVIGALERKASYMEFYGRNFDNVDMCTL